MSQNNKTRREEIIENFEMQLGELERYSFTERDREDAAALHDAIQLLDVCKNCGHCFNVARIRRLEACTPSS